MTAAAVAVAVALALAPGCLSATALTLLEGETPAALSAMLPREAGGSGGGAGLPLALGALGGMAAFLKDCLLDRAVLPLGRMELLPEVWTVWTVMGRASSLHTCTNGRFHALGGALSPMLAFLACWAAPVEVWASG
eukprot:353003-Chlamydomonas_euryale.AAC.5